MMETASFSNKKLKTHIRWLLTVLLAVITAAILVLNAVFFSETVSGESIPAQSMTIINTATSAVAPDGNGELHLASDMRPKYEMASFSSAKVTGQNEKQSISTSEKRSILSPIIENWKYWLCFAGGIICIVLIFRSIMRLIFYDRRRYPEKMQRFLESPVFGAEKRHIYDKGNTGNTEKASKHRDSHDTSISFFEDNYEEQYLLEDLAFEDESLAFSDAVFSDESADYDFDSLSEKIIEKAGTGWMAEDNNSAIQENKIPAWAYEDHSIPAWAMGSAEDSGIDGNYYF